MALNECKGCTTAFAVGLPRCPHCGSTDFAEQGQDMPKITAHGGPTNAAEPGPELTASTGAVIATSGAWADESELESTPEAAADQPEREWKPGDSPVLPPVPDDAYPSDAVPLEGGEESSPGKSSETSSETPSSEPEPSETPTPSRARKTASRSKKAPTGSRSADSAAGGPEDGTSAAESE